MVRKRTVFIIGAGGSIPYGLPSGQELNDLIICNTFLPGTLIYPPFLKNDYLKKYGVEVDPSHGLGRYWAKTRPLFSEYEANGELGKFCVKLNMSSINTIDHFIQLNTNFLQIGKLAIAQAILLLENGNEIFYSREDNWLRYLWQRMLTDKKSVHKNNISFITYNYDRVIEYFLSNALMHSCDIKNEDSHNIINTWGIHHIHGRLGKIEIGDGRDGECIPFGLQGVADENKNMLIQHAIGGFKLFYEAKPDNDIQNEIEIAERIYFLGFGFDEINLEKLFSKNINYSTKSIKGSALGLSQSQINSVRNFLKDLNESINLELFPVKNEIFLSDYCELY